MSNPSLDAATLRHVVESIPSDIRQLLSENPRKIILGGGFVREIVAGNEPNDLDLFCDTAARAKLMAEDLRKMRGPSCKVHVTGNAISVLSPDRITVQFVTRWVFDSPRSVIDSFDFTVCQAAVWRQGAGCTDAWVSECSPRFYQDLAGRNLVYTNPVRDEEAGGSLLRMVKFLRRGYRIQVTSLSDLMHRFYVATEDKVKKHEGRGTMVEVMCDLLREVDPNVVIDGLDISREHEVAKDGQADAS